MRTFRHLLLLTTALTAFAIAPAAAGPNGPNVVGGSATVSNPGTANVTVTQQSDRAIINWHMFDVGPNERVQFVQPNSSSITLNRVIGGLGPSMIYGTIDANGRVFIINRDGILFGANSVVNTSGFLATTHDIRNEDFMAGRFNFNIPGRPDASIVNLGTINANNGGFAALVAPGVRNSGTITATLGTVTLASGNGFSLDFYGDKLVTLNVGDEIAASVKDVATGLPLKSLVTNDGRIKADGGRVELTAAAARQVVDSVINTTGVIEANTIGTKNGMIVLGAATEKTKPAGAPTQTVKISGTLKAAGIKQNATTRGGKQTPTATGGTVIVTGENIVVAGAKIDVSGPNGGGKVMIGGDWGGGKPDTSLVSNPSAVLEKYLLPTATTVSVDAATVIDASAKVTGNGGKVILWADDRLTFTGVILATGGAKFGHGGFVETSGKTVDISGSVNAGNKGLWLLDPGDLTIDSALASSISTTLNGGTDVIQQTTASTPGAGNGDIFVNAQIVWNTTATLTLSAYRDILLPRLGVANITNTGGGNLVLRANNVGNFSLDSGHGKVVMGGDPSTRVDWTGSPTGSVTIYYNPSSYASPTNFASTVSTASPSQLTAYMLVNTFDNLQAIGTNGDTLSHNYALSRDIVGPSYTISPLGFFTGKFDGLGNTISNLTIGGSSPSPSNNLFGLFTVIDTTGVVKNLKFDNITVTANGANPSSGQFIGVLAGQNYGFIDNVTVTASTINANGPLSGVNAGGLVGQNQLEATIQNSRATVAVSVGDATGGDHENNAGGFVGVNHGSILNSFAFGNVLGGVHSNLGGFVGRNEVKGEIYASQATGNVTIAPAAEAQSLAGGFAGFNFGLIQNSTASGTVVGTNLNIESFSTILGGFVGINSTFAQITGSTATGAVIGHGNVETGGFVGSNNGTITTSLATGNVTGDGITGGFVAFNQENGTISGSTAGGIVTGYGEATGGFVGSNWNFITTSHATGNVFATTTNAVGGFVGQNVVNLENNANGVITFSTATGHVMAAGGPAIGAFAGINDGTISDSSATGNVTVPTATGPTTAGGFIGLNVGDLIRVTATGNVTIDAPIAFAGGLAGISAGSISESSATGKVTATGAFPVAGGLVGFNVGSIELSFATGATTVGDNGFAGGLVGINVGVPDSTIGSIFQSYALGPVTGGSNSFVAGLVGMNLGTIDQTYAAGLVKAGPNSTTGGLVAINTLPVGFDPGVIPSPSTGPGPLSTDGPHITDAPPPPVFPTGTVTNSYWDTVTTGQTNSAGGTPQTTAQLASGSTPLGYDPGVWTSNAGFYPCVGGGCNPAPQPGPPAAGPTDQHTDQPNPVDISPLLVLTQQLTKDPTDNKSGDPVPNTTTNNSTPSSTPGGPKPPGAPGDKPPSWFGPNAILGSGLPPLTETRFASDELVLQLRSDLTPEQIAALSQEFGLTVIASQELGLLGRTIYRFKITSGMSVRELIPLMEKKSFIAQAQPSYVFQLTQATQTPAGNEAPPKGDSAQYIVPKLRLNDVHLLATGKGVLVAVVDSTIDVNHPDLAGVIAQRFDAVGAELSPHAHGTGMAGAIASHKRLLGIAPNARLLAIQAFGVSSGGAQGTSLAIVKGLNWAVEQGAKVINMSFAGPKDPILEQAIKALRDKGVILIAAAGNAGPKSPPLFPGADPNVIAVSATDADDAVYKNANRGKYVAIAAPGVDILVPAPDGGYQLTTGTSVAAAHVSGVAALLLERNPNLKPDDVRRIITSTATKLKGLRPEEVGAGLIDPYDALLKVAPKTATIQ